MITVGGGAYTPGQQQINLSSAGTNIIEGPADMDIVGIDPLDTTKIITIATFKLLTIIATNGILSIKSIISIPVGVEVTNSLPPFSGHWLGVRDTGGTYEFFSKEKRLDFSTATECPIGRADRTATDISAIVSLPELGFGYAKTLYDFLATTGSKRLSGGDLQYVDGTITLKRLEGVWWRSFAAKDENGPHKMTNTERNPIASYEIHSATGDVEVLSEMEVGFIDDGAGGKTAIASNEWSFYLCYHWARHEGVGFEGYQRSKMSFTSLHDAKSLKGAVGELHPALDAAVLTHIIYIKGNATDFGDSEQCLIEWVRNDNIGSSGDPTVGSLQQSGVVDWVGDDILTINTDTTKFDRSELIIGSVDRETGVKFLRTVGAETDITVDNLTTNPFTYYGYNITTDSFVQQPTPMPGTTLDDILPVGRIWHRNNAVIDDTQTMPLVAETNHDYAGQLLAFNALKQNGLNLSANGANEKVNLSTGVLEVLGGTHTSRKNITQPLPSLPLSFTPVHRAVTTGKVVFEPVTDTPDYSVYDDGSGVLQTITPQQYGIHYFCIFSFGNSVDVFLIRGDESYGSLESAKIGLQRKSIPTPSDFKSGFTFSALIVKRGTIDLQTEVNSGDAIISTADRFGSFGAGGGGGDSGSVVAQDGFFYKADSSIVAFVKNGAGLDIKAGTKVWQRNGTVKEYVSDTAIITPTFNNNGIDYAIYVCDDGTIRADMSFEFPSGYTALNSRKIGGFHVNMSVDILEYSIWDLKFGPTCLNPKGMTLVADHFWVDIYLCNTETDALGTSKSQTTIADGNSPPKIPIAFGGIGSTYGSFRQYEAHELMSAYGKRLPNYAEFTSLAYGVTEETSLGSDPINTKYDVGFRSKWGVEQATGCKWQYGSDIYSTELISEYTTDGRGTMRPSIQPVAFGGFFLSNASAGSRASWQGYLMSYNFNGAARGVCNHFRSD